MTTRMKWLVGVLVLVTVGAAVYFSLLLSPASPAGFDFGNATTTGALPQSPNTPAKQTGTGATTPKKPSGYNIVVNGKFETITSTLAGVSLVAPVNSSVSQNRAVLTVRPPESGSGEDLEIQKTADSLANALGQISSTVNGTQHNFDGIHNAKDSAEYNPNNVAGPVHITKIKNLTVSGLAAVQVHIKADAVNGGGAQDFYLTWVRSGTTNWYIVRSSAGLTPAAAAALDQMFSSITLTP